jgi:AcrR family transcriptional regulator
MNAATDVSPRTAGRPRDPRLDDAIGRATIELLARGYEALSMEAIASRAGTTKAAIYRRWPSKADLVADVFTARAEAKAVAPDTGTLRGDLLAHAVTVITALTSEPVGPAVLNMIAAARTHPDLADLLHQGWVRIRRHVIAHTLDAAVERGELRARPNVELVADLLIGPIYYRLLVTGDPVDLTLATSLADAVVAVLATM